MDDALEAEVCECAVAGALSPGEEMLAVTEPGAGPLWPNEAAGGEAANEGAVKSDHSAKLAIDCSALGLP